MTDEAVEKRKSAMSEAGRRWQAKNPNKVREYRQRYYALNKEALNAKSREWRKNNPNADRRANARYKKSDKGKLTMLRGAYKKEAQIAAVVGATRLVSCYSCQGVFALEDAAQRGWKFVGKNGCICDLCE